MEKESRYSPPAQNENKAIVYMTVSAVTGAVVAASIKSLSATLSPLLAFWLSRFFPLLGLIPMALQGQMKTLKTAVFGRHLVLNCLYVSSIMLYFYALGFIPLVDASLLFNAAPLYAPVIAILFLKEHFPHRLWGYIGVSFLGVIFVIQPRSSVFNPVSLLAALSGLLMAAAQVCNRHLAHYDRPERIVFYMIVLAPVLGTIPLCVHPSLILDVRAQEVVSWVIIGKLVLAGVSTWLYQLYRSKSAALGRVSVVMPFSYLGVVFAGCFDWMFWGVLPNQWTLWGVVLIITGSLFILKTPPQKPSSAP
jgi:drug/metabolite transporter (DMT)-like permease